MRGSSRLNVVVFGGRACKFNSDYLNKLITNWHFFFFFKKTLFRNKTETLEVWIYVSAQGLAVKLG